MLVRMWMTRGPVTVTPETLISDAAVAMARHRVRHLPVVYAFGDQSRLAGIVSSHDLARAYPPGVNPFSVSVFERPIQRPVSEVMTEGVYTVVPTTPIDEAARLLLEHRVGTLPVVASGRLVGIFSRTDVLRALVEVLGGREAGVRITLDTPEDEDVVDPILAASRRHGLTLRSVLTLHHENRRLAVVRLQGKETEAFLDEMWRSRHRVESVVTEEGGED